MGLTIINEDGSLPWRADNILGASIEASRMLRTSFKLTVT